MIKNIFFFLGISFCAFLIAPTTYACDPLSCLLGGHKQDTLILGEVMSAPDDMDNARGIKIIFIFPQNQISSLKEGDEIGVRNFEGEINFYTEEAKMVAIDKKYVMSLNKDDNFYTPAWGTYEVAGSNYSDAKLVRIKYPDDAALQVFINSGGTERDFHFDGDKVFWRPSNGQKEKLIYSKEKNILWYGAGIGALVLIGGIVLIASTKK